MATATVHNAGIGDHPRASPALHLSDHHSSRVLFVCLVAAFGISPLYRLTATIMMELSSVPKDIIETTVISYADQQIEIVQGRVMTVDSLLNIVHDIDPYPNRKDWSANEKAQRILDNTSLERVDLVTLKPTQESNAFSLHYDNPNPKIAQAIDERLAQQFLTYNQLMRTLAAGEATGFLQKESEGLAQQMREVDVRIAEVKRKYGEALPEMLARNQSALEGLPALDRCPAAADPGGSGKGIHARRCS